MKLFSIKSLVIAGFLPFQAVSSFAQSAPGTPPAGPTPDATEISVTGDARIVGSSNFRIAIEVEQSGPAADKSSKTLDEQMNGIQTKLAALNPKVTLELIKTTFRGAPIPGQGTSGQIRSGQPLNVKRLYAVQINQLAQVGSVVDMLNQPGIQILDVEQIKNEDPSAVNSAIQLAAQRGHESAEKSAVALNVKLGPLLSSAVTIEPDGAEAQERMMKGGAIGLNEISQRVFVNLRYAIAR